MVMRYSHLYPESLSSGIGAMDVNREKIITILSQTPEFSPKTKGHKPYVILLFFFWCWSQESNRDALAGGGF